MINNVQNQTESTYTFSSCEQGEKFLSASIGDVILNANSSRKYAAFINNSSVDVTLVLNDKSKALINKGIVLKSRGGSYEINRNNLYLGVVSAISISNSQISFVECD